MFARLRLPVAPFLGSLTLVTVLRLAGMELGLTPPALTPVLQILLGIFVGSKVTREAARDIRPMVSSALIIITWSLSVVLLMGFLLSRITVLDRPTALLAFSMGGLPEITMIALSVNANLGFIILMQMARMLGTTIMFPIIFKTWLPAVPDTHIIQSAAQNSSPIKIPGEYKMAKTMLRITAVLALASAGGALFHYAGIPAGAMMGSTVFTAAASLAGIKIGTFPPFLFNLMLMALGLTIADNIMPASLPGLADPALIFPAAVATVIIFASSFLVALLLKRTTKWDLPTCFLAAAPGGFSIMVALAVKYHRDPFRVSMLHLCRLLSLKIMLPLLFMYL